MKIAKAADIKAKKAWLRRQLQEYGKVLVAFSGGKDSFFLLQAAREILGPANVLPFFVRTPFTLGAARERVNYLSDKFSLPVHEISIDLLQDPHLRQNSKQRCYHCKKKIFSALKKEARKLGIRVVVDGTTVSDLNEHRPGRVALEKLDIRSPLRDAGFTSVEIIGQLKKKGIDPYFLTSSTCLATRFPYNFSLRPQLIQAIGRVEHYLIRQGIFPLRVRHMTDGIRIETSPAHFRKIIAMKEKIIAECRTAGYRFITLDLAGIKSGCWDEFPAAKKRLSG
ncbi:MAG: ATP-dependent sacrificial sulfur transferase LarE [Candidatus Aminicenantes bacterium]|nr:ATP-dependent sacrificial sulfur transferase LarE [Candidatus Aminicenantes bacterium]